MNSQIVGQMKMQPAATLHAVASKYTIHHLIDEGTSGKVFKATQIQTQLPVAIKQIRLKSEAQLNNLTKEIEIMRQLTVMSDNLFTSKLIDVIHTEAPTKDGQILIFLVMPYWKSNLRRLLSQTGKIDFNEQHIMTIFYNFLCSLNYVHSAGLIHRDIKPSNVLIDDKCRVYLCDFGLSCLDLMEQDQILNVTSDQNQQPQQRSQTPKMATQNKRVRFSNDSPVSTYRNQKARVFSPKLSIKRPKKINKRKLSPYVCARWYRPPEIILVNHDYNQKIDIWSAGCILAEMLLCLKMKTTKYESDKQYLFAGSHCHPLSPRTQKKPGDLDQLNAILLGLPQLKPDDISFIQNDQTMLYLKNVKDQVQIQEERENLISERLRGLPSDLKDLLLQMIQFNPSKRPTAYQCLQHKVFDRIRQPQFEKQANAKILANQKLLINSNQ